MQVVNASLLDAPQDFAIVQCISEDCAMGVTRKGVEIPSLALDLRKKYPLMPELCKSYQPLIGDVILYDGYDGRFIFNLVTKKNYYEKPAYGVMLFTLNRLRSLAIKSGLMKLAIPKLGCGLDRLEWTRVSEMINQEFNDSGIEVVLYDPKKDITKERAQFKALLSAMEGGF